MLGSTARDISGSNPSRSATNYVAPDARLSNLEIKWGLVPDMGGMAIMRELARADVVRELAFTGREFSGADASSECFGFVKDWVEKKIRRHMLRARKRQGFGWTRWSRDWLYETLGCSTATERCG